MNPEENQPNGATTGAAPAATPTPETASPDLDQLAADLANVSSTDLAAEPTPATADAPQTLEMPAELVSDQPAPVADAAPETPAEAPAEMPAAEAQSTGGSVTLEPSSDLMTAAGSPGIATVPTDANQATVPDPITDTPAAPETPTETPAAEASSAETLNALDQESNDTNVDASAEENGETAQKPINEDDPIEPAKPVPGSIGSALAYDESAPNNAVPVAKPQLSPEQAKTRNIIIAAVVGGVVLIIAVIVVIIMLTSKPKTNLQQPTSNSNTTSSDLDSITCSRELNEEELAKYAVGDLAPSYGEEKFVATYEGDDMFDAAHTIAVTYDSRAVLERAKSVIEKVYKEKLEDLSLAEDPFDSEYQSSGDVAMAYHYTTLDKLTEKNAELLGIGTSSEGVASSLKNIRSTFRQNGFECTVKAN